MRRLLVAISKRAQIQLFSVASSCSLAQWHSHPCLSVEEESWSADEPEYCCLGNSMSVRNGESSSRLRSSSLGATNSSMGEDLCVLRHPCQCHSSIYCVRPSSKTIPCGSFFVANVLFAPTLLIVLMYFSSASAWNNR